MSSCCASTASTAGAAAHEPRARAVVVRRAGHRAAARHRRHVGRRGHDSHHHAGCPACEGGGEDHRGDVPGMTERVVLVYDGGLAASAAIPWLTETHGVEVTTITLDIGQGRDLAALRARALACGAVRAHAIDARDEFARDVLLPSLYRASHRQRPACDRRAAAAVHRQEAGGDRWHRGRTQRGAWVGRQHARR